ncbi:MAG: MFS transporter, partial [Actinomycetota bacterium]|nr:MFS transporter [Actinomycetota bacterium]
IVTCFGLAAVTETLYVAHLSELAVVLGGFVLGFAAQGSKICVDTIVQESVDDEYRGRVFSFYDVLFNVSFVSAAAFAALAVPASGASRPVYALIALGYAATSLGYARASRPYAARERAERAERAGLHFER